MNKKITIAIDAMGGENSPDKILKGIKIFLEKNKNNDDFVLKLYGNKDLIKKKISNLGISSKFLNIVNTQSVVADNETPLTAIKSNSISL